MLRDVIFILLTFVIPIVLYYYGPTQLGQNYIWYLIGSFTIGLLYGSVSESPLSKAIVGVVANRIVLTVILCVIGILFLTSNQFINGIIFLAMGIIYFLIGNMFYPPQQNNGSFGSPPKHEVPFNNQQEEKSSGDDVLDDLLNEDSPSPAPQPPEDANKKKSEDDLLDDLLADSPSISSFSFNENENNSNKNGSLSPLAPLGGDSDDDSFDPIEEAENKLDLYKALKEKKPLNILKRAKSADGEPIWIKLAEEGITKPLREREQYLDLIKKAKEFREGKPE